MTSLEQTALKMKLEKQFVPKLRTFFRSVSTEVGNYYSLRGSLPSYQPYQNELQVILLQHYRKVSTVFKDTLRKTIQKQCEVEIKKDADTNIDSDTASYNMKRAAQMSAAIISTMRKDAGVTLQNLMNAMMTQRTPITNRGLGLSMTAPYKQRLYNHAPTIAQTETQNVAESTKSIEASAVMSDVVAGGVTLSPDNFTKTWSTILDDRTREWHAEADDQTVANDEPFIVNGEQLMFPGDTSLGASISNIINCRCNTDRAIDMSGLPDFVNRPIKNMHTG